jgi:2-isopropylmalate synthase
MESLGIEHVDIGTPGAGTHVASEALRLASEIAAQRMRIRPYCAARTFITDIRPIADKAKASDHILTDQEIEATLKTCQ